MISKRCVGYVAADIQALARQANIEVSNRSSKTAVVVVGLISIVYVLYIFACVYHVCKSIELLAVRVWEVFMELENRCYYRCQRSSTLYTGEEEGEKRGGPGDVRRSH